MYNKPLLSQLIITANQTYSPQGKLIHPPNTLVQRLQSELGSLQEVQAWVLQHIQLLAWQWPKLSIPPKDAGFLITSQQGLHSLALGIPIEERSHYRLLVVGETSARLAHDYGFSVWPLPPKPSNALHSVQYTLETQTSLPQTWLWGHGTYANPEAQQYLESQGYRVIPLPLYTQKATQEATVHTWLLASNEALKQTRVVWTAPSMVRAFWQSPEATIHLPSLWACQHISFSHRVTQLLNTTLMSHSTPQTSVQIDTLALPNQTELLKRLRKKI